MSDVILAAFDAPEEAQKAAARLLRDGFPREAVTLMSNEPLHFDTGETAEKGGSLIGLFAVAGGLIGAALAALLTVLTSRSTGIVTGGMPVVAPWAFGIIVFEMTALGAILATLGRLIYEARLARRGSLVNYSEAVADGRVVLAVACSNSDRASAAESILGDRRIHKAD